MISLHRRRQPPNGRRPQSDSSTMGGASFASSTTIDRTVGKCPQLLAAGRHPHVVLSSPTCPTKPTPSVKNSVHKKTLSWGVCSSGSEASHHCKTCNCTSPYHPGTYNRHTAILGTLSRLWRTSTVSQQTVFGQGNSDSTRSHHHTTPRHHPSWRGCGGVTSLTSPNRECTCPSRAHSTS